MPGDSVKLVDGKAQRNIAKRLFPGLHGYIPRNRAAVVRMLLPVASPLSALASVYCFFLYPYSEVFSYALLTWNKNKKLITISALSFLSFSLSLTLSCFVIIPANQYHKEARKGSDNSSDTG